MKLTILAQSLEARAVSETFDLAKSVTPASMTGFSLAVLLLLAGLYTSFKLYREQKDENRRIMDSHQKVTNEQIEVMVAVRNRLDDQRLMQADITELKHTTNAILKGQDEMKHMLRTA